MNVIAFHLQQALEKAVKHQIEMSGKEFEFTHNFAKLFRGHEDLKQKLPQVLKENLAELTEFEVASRYVRGYRDTLRKINEIYPVLREYVYGLLEEEVKAETEVQAEEAAKTETDEFAETSEFKETGDSSVKSLRKAVKMALQELRQDKD